MPSLNTRTTRIALGRLWLVVFLTVVVIAHFAVPIVRGPQREQMFQLTAGTDILQSIQTPLLDIKVEAGYEGFISPGLSVSEPT